MVDCCFICAGERRGINSFWLCHNATRLVICKLKTDRRNIASRLTDKAVCEGFYGLKLVHMDVSI